MIDEGWSRSLHDLDAAVSLSIGDLHRTRGDIHRKPRRSLWSAKLTLTNL